MKPIPGFSDPSLPVPILQGDPEFRRLVELYESLRPRAALEIGSLFGGTLFYWITRAPRGATVISVDMDVAPQDSRLQAQTHGRSVLWPAWATEAGVTLHTLVGPSNTFRAAVAALAGGGLDFVFIDGNHTYPWARSDFETYWDLVNPGGVIALHDIYRNTEVDEVWKLWAEIREQGHDCQEFSSVSGQDDWGIGVVRKRGNVNLAVVTPVTRPANLPVLFAHLRQGAAVPGLTLTWYTVHDAPGVTSPLSDRPDWVVEDAFHRPDTAGKAQVNYALQKYLTGQDTLVWVLDDDNLPHPDFFLAVRNTAAFHPQAHGFAFAQELDGGDVRGVSPSTMRCCHIDQAQYVWSERGRDGALIPECYTGDGMFAETLYNAHPQRWVFVNAPLTYYNRLRL